MPSLLLLPGLGLLLLLSPSSAWVNETEIHGFKKLIREMDHIYMTCHIVFFAEMVDYETADQRCKDFKYGMGYTYTGNLATVNDTEKNDDLVGLLDIVYDRDPDNQWAADQWVWAGLRKTKNHYGFSYTKVYNLDDWEWANGDHPVPYEMWMSGQPDQRRLKKDGVYYYQNQMRVNHQGLWDDTFTYKIHPYACDYQGHFIIGMDHVTWSKAKGECANAGLILAKVRTSADLNELKRLMTLFLGDRDETLRTFHRDNWLWVGGNDKEEEGTWTWVDGEPIEEFYGMQWKRKMPDNAQYLGNEGQNVLAVSRWGDFDDSFRHTRKRRFVCMCPSFDGF